MGVAEADLTSWSHMIDKPPGTGRPTYWHQDEAYWEPSVEHRAVGAWMPLTECSVDMGCMQFLAGSHRGEILPHHSRRPDIRPDLYEVIDEIDEAAAVACPLPAGGATFHHLRTLHYTAPNVTDRPRRAYAIEFETTPVVRTSPSTSPGSRRPARILGHPESRRYMADGELREL